MKKNIKEQLVLLPVKSGVYLFKDSVGNILYIGKAAAIRKRVQSYFRDRPMLLPRIEKMVSQLAKIDHIETKSEIEALLLESQLIKKQQPKYNAEWKDDKNFLYIKIENPRKVKFPAIYTIRKTENDGATYFGPFTDASAVRKTLNFLRRIFLFRTCKRFSKKPCLDYHIERCLGPCTGEISKKEYLKYIRQTKSLLLGKTKTIIKELKKEMKTFSQEQEYEKSAKIRDKINALEHIGKIAILKRELEGERPILNLINFLKEYFPTLIYHTGFRIECYDVSNISGSSGTGSMVVFIDDKKTSYEYRKFKIKTVFKIDDVACMKEVLKRRLKHKEWMLPDLIMLDGGKGQLKAAREALKELRISIPYLGLAKKEEQVYLPNRKNPISLPKDSPALLLLRQIRDEAHRFAKKYHLKLRSKKILS